MSYRRTKNSLPFFTIPLFFLCLLPVFGFSQSNKFSGQVVSSADQSPLPFVHLRFDSGNSGTISNIDGNFTIPDTVRQVELTYIGFKSLVLSIRKSYKENWIVQLDPDNKLLSTIEIHPGKDKAYRIMESVLEHAKENDPENLESFQYTSYHKFWLSADAQTDNHQSGKARITPNELGKLQQKFEANHMLLIETLSQKKFLQPNHENEEILSSKVSGLKKESFFLLATQLQFCQGDAAHQVSLGTAFAGRLFLRRASKTLFSARLANDAFSGSLELQVAVSLSEQRDGTAL